MPMESSTRKTWPWSHPVGCERCPRDCWDADGFGERSHRTRPRRRADHPDWYLSDASPATTLSVTVPNVTVPNVAVPNVAVQQPAEKGTPGPLNDAHLTNAAAAIALNSLSSIADTIQPSVTPNHASESQTVVGLSSSLVASHTTPGESSNALPFGRIEASWRNATSGLDISSLDHLMAQSSGEDYSTSEIDLALSLTLGCAAGTIR